jgi:outer membrane receptor protein involved in Fe transport
VFSHNSYVGVTFHQLYEGLYAQDAWRATDRITVNAGLRWEPFTGQNVTQGSVTNFNEDNFRRNVRAPSS